MKLITEMQDENAIQMICEVDEASGSKTHYIKGIFLQAEVANRNKRMYPELILQRECTRYVKENVEKNRAYGELGHPQGPTINLDRVSHMITSLKQEGTNFIGKAKITDTPMGNIVKSLIDEGASLGVSSRGMGSLRPGNDGINEVQDDFYLATPADIVADPSAPDAYVDGIMEGKEWVWDNGLICEESVYKQKLELQATKQKNLEEAKLKIFKQFLDNL